MKAVLVFVLILLVVAWAFAVPYLVLLAINAIVPNAVEINQWTYLATFFLLMILSGGVFSSRG